MLPARTVLSIATLLAVATPANAWPKTILHCAVDILLQDLYKPDSNRLRRNLSGIINFAKFREEKLVPYTDMQESVEHLLEETAELENFNMRLVSRAYSSTTPKISGMYMSANG